MPRRKLLWAYGVSVAALLLIFACGKTDPRIVREDPSLAPYVASPEAVVEIMLRMAEVGPQDVVYDLGSGDGRIVIMAAKQFGAKGVGFELDGDLIRRAQENARRAGVAHLVEFRQQDVLTADFSPATVVTIYLSREANLKLRPVLQAQLRPGARIVSHEFDMGDWRPEAVRQLLDEGSMTRRLYLWCIGGRRP